MVERAKKKKEERKEKATYHYQQLFLKYPCLYSFVRSFLHSVVRSNSRRIPAPGPDLGADPTLREEERKENKQTR